jgi:outer membrane protein assembly factor BamA
VKVEASAAIDWRDNPAHPHAGGRYGVTAAKFDDRDLNSFDFHRIDVSLQQYVPLTDRYRILALRAEGVFTEGDHGQTVPFYFQPTLDGALFVDAGTVAARRQDLSLGDMDVSYGIGFRFHSNSAVVGRLDLAFSREGFVPLLRFEHVF